MQTCSVCLMVLDESGICRLCGSEEKVGFGSTDTQDTDDSVDMPFGLGQDSKQGPLGLPFGFNHSLPFGIDDGPSENKQNSQEKRTNLQLILLKIYPLE